MRGILVFAVVLVLAVIMAGCKSAKTIERVPYPVPCVESMPERPGSAFWSLESFLAIDDQVDALLLDHAFFEAHIIKLEALIRPCLIVKTAP